MNYSSERAATYAATRGASEDVLSGLIEEGRIGRQSRVLEAGCGSGNYSRGLNAITSCVAEGFDPSEGMLEEARKRGGTISMKQGTAEEIARLYPPDSFDLVFSVDVIHHIADIPAYFAGARKVLKEGGRICTATDDETIIRRRRPLSEYWPETIAHELRRYPPLERLHGLLKDASFSNVFSPIVSREYRLISAEPYERQAFSSLLLVSPEEFRRGLQRLRDDLVRGPIIANSSYVLLWATKG